MKNIDIEIMKNTIVAWYRYSVFQKSAMYKVDVIIVITNKSVLRFLKWANQMDGW